MLKQFKLCFFLLTLCLSGTISGAQSQRKTIHIFLEVRETNLEKPSTVAVNTLSERLAAAGFRVTTKKREAELVIEGTFASRPTAVTDDVKREGGVNAEAYASLRLLSDSEIIATSVEHSAPGDWAVNAERVGEDRLIEVAGRVAEDLFSGDFVQEVKGAETKSSPEGKPQSKPSSRPTTRKTSAPKRGVSFLEVANLVQNFAPEDRIVAALKKYGIKFKPRDAAINQLRSLGASETVINAVKSSTVNS